MAVLRQWWPVPGFLAAAVVARQLWEATLPEARGHAAGHVASAAALFPMMAVFAIIVWAVPRLRRNPEVWALGAVLAIALLVALAGDIRVVNAIHGDNWSDAQASALGPSRPGFASGHHLASVGQLAAVATVVVLIVALRIRRHISTRVAIGAVAASVVFPSWIVPGAGVLVLAGVFCVVRFRRLREVHPTETRPRSGCQLG